MDKSPFPSTYLKVKYMYSTLNKAFSQKKKKKFGHGPDGHRHRMVPAALCTGMLDCGREWP